MKGMPYFSSFLLPADWNEDEMAQAEAAILSHAVATCREWQDKKESLMRQNRTAHLHWREKKFYLLEVTVIFNFLSFIAEPNPNWLEEHSLLESDGEGSHL